MNAQEVKPKNPFGYDILRSLSWSSCTYLSRERASERLVVLKYFETRQKPNFEKEAKILAEVANFAAAPKLYFAIEMEGETEPRFCLGMEYIAGRTLLELVEAKTAVNWLKIEENVFKHLTHLHEEYGISHGDLSPRNILVKALDQHVVFIDWEFAEKRSDQNLSSYDTYRGTQGFSTLGGQSDLMGRDWESLEACLKYCGVLNPFSRNKTAVSKSFFARFKGTKHDRKRGY